MKLIDKDALVAEIEKRIKKYATLDVGNSEELEAIYGAKCKTLIDILSFLDTLEVKEVDLEKNISSWYYHLNIPENYNIPQTVMVIDIVEKTAKHFFELGLKAQKGE